MKTISRRQFIQGSTAAFVLNALGSFPLLAEEDLWNPLSSKDRILVVIQLMGGNDGLSTVIPAGNPLYAENR
ncbi:MAG: twin-arginine translocation signal domain-containing protein, partial [Planctomycetota bacterium]